MFDVWKRYFTPAVISASVLTSSLNEMEFVTFHGDFFSHILISVHTDGELVNSSIGSSEEQNQNISLIKSLST